MANKEWTGKTDKFGKKIKVGDTVGFKIYRDGGYQSVFGKVDFINYAFGLWIDSAWWPFNDLRGQEFEIVDKEM